MAFAPLATSLADPICPTEAINLIAGAKSDDPFKREAYEVSAEEIYDANSRLFGWLSSGAVIGGVETADGRWRRLDLTWLRSHRRHERNWIKNVKDPKGDLLPVFAEKIDRLPDVIRGTNDSAIEGRAWFVERAELLDCRDGLSGLSGDDRLVAKMRVGVGAGSYKNLLQASMALARVADGGGTLENKANRLRLRERATRSGS